MARNQSPVSEEEIEALREEMDEQREDIREDLAMDLGGEPADYDAETYFRTHSTGSDEAVPDGGDTRDDDE